MTDALSLAKLRTELGRTWLITLFGIAYAISQITSIVILGPIEDARIKLQTTGTSVADYLAVFNAWEASGDMASTVPIFSSMTFTGSGTRCFLPPRCAGFSTDSCFGLTATGLSYFHLHPDYSIGTRTTCSMYS